MKNVRDIENYARQIKEAGLERDLVGTGLYHYCIDIEFVKGKDTNDILMSMPSAFEGCFDYNKLDQSEQETVNKVYGSKYKPTPVPTVKATKMTAADYEELGISKDIFVKAYRIFKKSNMK